MAGMDDLGDGSDLFAIYGDDAAIARARADAMARRARGLQNAGLIVRTLAGERDPTGGLLSQMGQKEEAQLAGAAQHQAQLGVQRQHYQTEAERAAAQLARQQSQDAQTQAFREAQLRLQREGLGLKRQQLLVGGGRREQNDERRQRLDATKAASDLRKELQNQQVYKDAQTVSSAWEKIKNTGESGAGDMSLIFGYMKILDPNSTVREGEYATAATAGSIPQNVLASYNRALSGEKLAPEVRKQFRIEAAKVYDAQLGRYKQTAERYKGLAEKGGIPPEDVVLDVFGGQGSAPAGAVAPTPGAAPTPARVRRTVGGETREWDGKAWVPVAGGAP